MRKYTTNFACIEAFCAQDLRYLQTVVDIIEMRVEKRERADQTAVCDDMSLVRPRVMHCPRFN